MARGLVPLCLHSSRLSLRLDQKIAHSTERPVLITDQPYIFCFQNCFQDFAMSRQKIGQFQNSESIFNIKFQLNLPNFFLLNILNYRSNFHHNHFNFWDIFDKFYLINLCPVFVGSLENLSNRWKKIAV